MTDTASRTEIGAIRLVASLAELGVELVFGLPGVHNLPIWKALSESGVRFVGVRHEQTSVYAADGYARATGRLGVAVVTTGPGAANTLGTALAGTGPTVCVCGDGGFMYACGELATVVQERIPVTIVLVDGGGYGMLRFDQRLAGEEPFGVDLVTPDFAALAASFGVPSTRVEGFGPEFERALGRSLDTGDPSMIIVRASLKPPPTTSPRWYRKG